MLSQVFDFIRTHDLQHQIHLNRTRFYVPTVSNIYTEFVLRYADHCPLVDPSLDTQTGF